MKNVIMVIMVMVMFVGCGSTESSTPTVTQEISYSVGKQSNIDSDLMLALVNDARVNGAMCGETYYAPVSPLSYDRGLTGSARSKSYDLSVSGKIVHEGSATSSDEIVSSSDRHFVALIKLHTGGVGSYGENIAYGQSDEEEVVAAWLNSPTHCANIMQQKFNHVGMIAWEDKYGIKSWTQHFSN